MILITGTFRIRAGALKAARPAMDAMITASRAKAGCLAYAYAPDLDDETIVHVFERWENREAFDRHVASEHLAVWRAQFPELGIAERRLELFEVAAGETV